MRISKEEIQHHKSFHLSSVLVSFIHCLLIIVFIDHLLSLFALILLRFFSLNSLQLEAMYRTLKRKYEEIESEA